MLKAKNYPRILCLGKVSFRNKSEKKIFSDIQNKEFTTNSFTQQEMLKEVIQVGGQWYQTEKNLNLYKGMKTTGSDNHMGKYIQFFSYLNF